jgi:enoyl-CoA hydratase
MTGITDEVSYAAGKVLAGGSGGVRHLRLNKPAKLNALDWDMLQAIEELMARWEREGAAVVVVSSTVAKAFCVGADIEVLAEMDAQKMQEWELLGNRVLDRLQFSPLISVAAVSGFCLGGGCTLALACDFRIASGNATFGQPEIELGWIPGWGGVARMQALTGPSIAKELCMTGVRVNATRAAAIGLVNRFCEMEELEAQSAEFAEGLARRSAPALQTIKAISLGPAMPSDPRARRLDALANAALLQAESSQAAIEGFRRKTRGKG